MCGHFDCRPELLANRARGLLSAEDAKHVGDKENQQYRSKAYPGPAAGTPTIMPVVPSTEAKNQY